MLIFQSWGRRLGVGEGGLQSPGSRTWTQQRVLMLHVNHRWGSWGPTAQSWIWRWWNIFFRLNSLFKITHLKHFCCQQTETPRITGFKTCPKECNKSRSGYRGSCLGAEIVYLYSRLTNARIGATRPPRRWLTWNRRTRCWGNEK